MKNMIACSQELSELPIESFSMDDFVLIISKFISSAVGNADVSICYRIAADFPLKMTAKNGTMPCSCEEAETLASRQKGFSIVKNDPLIQTKEKTCFLMPFYEKKQISMIILICASKKVIQESEKHLIHLYDYIHVEHGRMIHLRKTYAAAARRERGILLNEMRNSLRSRKSFQRWYIQRSHYDTEAGSDFADLSRCPDGSWFFYICDITAQPLERISALYITDACMSRAAENMYPVNAVCRQTARSIGAKNIEAYISLVCGMYNPDRKKLFLSGAGSCMYIFFCHDTGEMRKSSFSEPLGRTFNYPDEMFTFDVGPGDILFTCTDGASDLVKSSVSSTSSDIFGDLISKHFFASAEQIADKITSLLESTHITASDDWTFQVIKFE